MNLRRAQSQPAHPLPSPTMTYLAAESRYDTMPYRRSGRSGLKLPAVSLGLWHNFGHVDRFDNARAVVRHAFDAGITHFDLANNYGPPPGSAESVFGDILKLDFGPYRDELIISSKAGYRMGPGPYGEWGSRKNLISSLDQSLKRLGLDYVDIFYSHRPDPDTPLEETMGALDHIVRSGRALYVGVSNYPPQMLREAAALLRQMGTPCLIHQPRYSLFDRHIEGGLLDALRDEGVGCIAFSPLAQGLLTDKYLGGIPADSRAAKSVGFLTPNDVTPERLATITRLNDIASSRGQKLSQMALAWVLRHPGMTSVLIGASRISQIDDAVGAVQKLDFNDGEYAAIEQALRG
jgi:L-glyceraldehyde 3-phosphate reductase